MMVLTDLSFAALSFSLARSAAASFSAAYCFVKVMRDWRHSAIIVTVSFNLGVTFDVPGGGVCASG